MTKRKLRKNADISYTQSPHDDIHTCSKGCSKPGCNRTLRDTIEEQDKQIEALKRDVLEKTAELRNLKEVVHDLRISAEDDLDSIDTAREEIARLQAELRKSEEHNEALCERMQDLNSEVFAASNINAKMHMNRVHDLNQMGGQCEEIGRLKAEVERLSQPAVIGGYNLSQYIRMANSETLEFDNGDIFADMTLPERIKYIVESHARLKAEVERLTAFTTRTIIPNEELQEQVERMTKAGDAMADEIISCYRAEGYDPADSETIPKWNAAKEGKQP